MIDAMLRKPWEPSQQARIVPGIALGQVRYDPDSGLTGHTEGGHARAASTSTAGRLEIVECAPQTRWAQR